MLFTHASISYDSSINSTSVKQMNKRESTHEREKKAGFHAVPKTSRDREMRHHSFRRRAKEAINKEMRQRFAERAFRQFMAAVLDPGPLQHFGRRPD
ncbi:hypothetical protein M0D68_14390 [Paraburkholderia sp. SEWSISQ10-3 4]|uniref:hypothetical protein n=1 Tax=Paraburkholderia TaxID=1822464 RepID=UPI00225669D8|nr:MULTISPECIES: hypothetical protein [Paraburkholderia]MCX4139380.1 hypothetical protein [Paraburkholderia aspalathi]MDN7172068.1 hypothetical protein [Paraburkholderia sp. SEWSISQ10-3 4]MDQ6501707.1 hypothetical protein [Paraburkholderia aspalathi]